MTNDVLKIKLAELLPAATFEEGSEWTTIQLSTARFFNFHAITVS
jgi:hypothetical protein